MKLSPRNEPWTWWENELESDWPSPDGAVPLLRPVLRDGHRVGSAETLEAARDRFEADLTDLPEPARALRSPRAPVPDISGRLRALSDRVQAGIRSGSP